MFDTKLLLSCFCFLLYSYSIVSIILAQEYGLYTALITYIVFCFPITLGLSCCFISLSFSIVQLSSLFILKNVIVITTEKLPNVFFIWIGIDVFLHLIFFTLIFINKKKKQVFVKNDILPTTVLVDTTNLETTADENLDHCSICLEKMYVKLVITPCKHIFHNKCINKWMENKKECPLCRTIM